MKAKLLGKNIDYSISPQLHALLGIKEYEVLNVEKSELAQIFSARDFDLINVTVPYKKECVKFLDEKSDKVIKIGAVNTVIKKGGKLYGYNTDYFGIEKTFVKMGVNPKNKRVLVLGNGGAASTLIAYLKDKKAKRVYIAERRGEINFSNAHERCGNVQIIINATPVGGESCETKSLIDLSLFPKVKFVFDMVYLPQKTPLLMQAKERGIKFINGLYMLVAQGYESEELLFGKSFDFTESDIEKTYESIKRQIRNVVMVGISGAGKTSVGKALSLRLKAEFFDTDDMIEKTANMTIPEIFDKYGEEYFRSLEGKVIADVCKKRGAVISVGGGAVKSRENARLLSENATVVFIKRKLKDCDMTGRPLAKSFNELSSLYKKREKTYKSIADVTVKNVGNIEKVAKKISEKI